MKEVGEVNTAVQGHEMLNGYWGTERTFVSCTFFVSRGACKLYPVVVIVPRHMIDQMPAAHARQPSPNCATSLAAFVFTNEGTEKSMGGWHVSLLIDIPMVTKLGKIEKTGSISGLGIWCEGVMDG